VTALAIAAGILFALGFARYELPAAVDRYRRKLERDRLEREAKALASEQAQAALALAIDKKSPPIGPSPIPRLVFAESGVRSGVPARPWMSESQRRPAPNPTRPSTRRM